MKDFKKDPKPMPPAPLFCTGILTITPGALDVLPPDAIVPLIDRHKRGDWGDLAEEDKAANDDALEAGERLFSSYNVGAVKVWIITETDRSSTTILLPEEY